MHTIGHVQQPRHSHPSQYRIRPGSNPSEHRCGGCRRALRRQGGGGRGPGLLRHPSHADTLGTDQAAVGSPGLHRGLHRPSRLFAKLRRDLRWPCPVAQIEGHGARHRPPARRSRRAGHGKGQGPFHRADARCRMTVPVAATSRFASVRPGRLPRCVLPRRGTCGARPGLRSFFTLRSTGRGDAQRDCGAGR
jgi:hypothetical protein